MPLRRGLARAVCALLFAVALICAPATVARAAEARAPVPEERAPGQSVPGQPMTGERVPEEVADYFERGLLPRLTDLYAPTEGGTRGIDFGESTAVGAITRLRAFSDAFKSDPDARPVAYPANEWVAPVMAGELALGVALVWINPGSHRAELAEFYPGQGFAGTLRSLPEGQLVRDPGTSSWFVVDADVATPLITGTTGITAPVALEKLPAVLAAPTEEPETDGGTTVLPVLLLAGFAAVVGLVLAGTQRRKGAVVGE